VFNGKQVGSYVGFVAWRGVLVEIFVEVYFVANFGFICIPPGVIGKGYYFPFKKGLYVFFQRYVFVIL
jgi:hypothetical protein